MQGFFYLLRFYIARTDLVLAKTSMPLKLCQGYIWIPNTSTLKCQETTSVFSSNMATESKHRRIRNIFFQMQICM